MRECQLRSPTAMVSSTHCRLMVSNARAWVLESKGCGRDDALRCHKPAGSWCAEAVTCRRCGVHCCSWNFSKGVQVAVVISLLLLLSPLLLHRDLRATSQVVALGGKLVPWHEPSCPQVRLRVAGAKDCADRANCVNTMMRDLQRWVCGLCLGRVLR